MIVRPITTVLGTALGVAVLGVVLTPGSAWPAGISAHARSIVASPSAAFSGGLVAMAVVLTGLEILRQRHRGARARQARRARALPGPGLAMPRRAAWPAARDPDTSPSRRGWEWLPALGNRGQRAEQQPRGGAGGHFRPIVRW